MDLTLVNIDCQNVVGLFSIAGYLRSKGYSVEIIDGPAKWIKKRLARRGNKLSLVGFTATTVSIKAAASMCNFVKSNISQSVVCLIGGFHASALPKETLMDFQFDIAVVGEGELTIEEILRARKNGSSLPYNIKGTVERHNGAIIVNAERDLMHDLDILGYPAYDLVDFDYYAMGALDLEYKNRYSATMLLSRGCPFNCIFCCSRKIWKGEVRTHSSEYALDLVSLMNQRYNVSFINFLDDNFFAKRPFFVPFMEGFMQRGLHKKILWSCQSTSTHTTLENLMLAKRAGCVLVQYGFESFNQPILDFLKRGYVRVEDHTRAIDNCIKTGMPFMGSFIVGTPMESIESIMANINVMLKYPFRLINTCTLRPFPGTALWDMALQNGTVNNHMDWDILNSSRALLKYDNFTPEQIEAVRKYVASAIAIHSYTYTRPPSADHEANLRRIKADDFSVIPRVPGYSLRKAYPKWFKIFLSPYRVRSLIKRKMIAKWL